MLAVIIFVFCVVSLSVLYLLKKKGVILVHYEEIKEHEGELLNDFNKDEVD